MLVSAVRLNGVWRPGWGKNTVITYVVILVIPKVFSVCFEKKTALLPHQRKLSRLGKENEIMGRFWYFEYLVAIDAGQDGDVVRLVEHVLSRSVPLIEEFKQKLSPLLWSQSILWCCDVSLFISVRCSHVANDLSSVRVPELLPATITITITRGFFGLVITIKNKKRSEVSWREGWIWW